MRKSLDSQCCDGTDLLVGGLVTRHARLWKKRW